MPEDSIIFVDPENGGAHPISPGLRSIFRRLLSHKPLSALKPFANRVLAAAEPSRQINLHRNTLAINSKDCSTLTVISANLWHDYPRQRRIIERLEAFARLVEGEAADIVLLQEVSRTPRLLVDRWLGDRLGMSYIYSRANGHARVGFEEGLAVYSRYAISQPRLAQLGRTTGLFVRRLALGAQVETPCGSLLAFSVHLSLAQGKNSSQVRQLQSWIASLAGSKPALVGGDFNTHETSAHMRQTRLKWLDTFRHVNPEADGTTHTLRWPWGSPARRRLDYIFLHSVQHAWRVLETRHLETPGGAHSDHNAVLTRLLPAAALA